MRAIIYHVAATADDFAADPNGGIHFFDRTGPQIEDYITSLTSYDAFLMGRGMYEFSFQYGLKPGESPYPHMNGFIYGSNLELEPIDEKLTFVIDRSLQFDQIRNLQREEGGSIFLAGGAEFAMSLIIEGLVDEVHLRRHQVRIRAGITCVPESILSQYFNVVTRKTYTNGVVLSKYSKKKTK